MPLWRSVMMMMMILWFVLGRLKGCVPLRRYVMMRMMMMMMMMMLMLMLMMMMMMMMMMISF